MNANIKLKRNQFNRRKKSLRYKVRGNSDRPRVSVKRSNRHIYAQIIDDEAMKTIVSFSDLKIENKKAKPIEIAEKVGNELGKLAKKKKISKVVFDRSGYKYHGRVKALAEGLRRSGLIL